MSWDRVCWVGEQRFISSRPGKSLICLRKNRNTNVTKAEYMRDEIMLEAGAWVQIMSGRGKVMIN